MREGRGREHLQILARRPRPPGSEAEREARSYCEGVLAGAGYTVREEPFSFSAFPGRWGTPIAGALSGGGLWYAAAVAREGRTGEALAIMAGIIASLALVGITIATLGTRLLPILRERSSNLVALPPGAWPVCWLVAHSDSKSQPVPILIRAGGIMLHAAVWLVALGVAAAGAVGWAEVGEMRGVWLAVGMAGLVSAIPIVASTVGSHSPGAVDNASGVAAVLSAAEKLAACPDVGILVTSAEELGLAGAREWAFGKRPAVAINCDGVDDAGSLVVMHGWRRPDRLVDLLLAAGAGSTVPVSARRLTPGILLDSVAFADAGWEAVTVSRGSWRTLARVHTAGDDLSRLEGDGIEDAAGLLAAAAMEARTWS
jgi:hypothetical protein